MEIEKPAKKCSLNSVCDGFYVLKMDFMPNNQQEMKDLKEKNEELKAQGMSLRAIAESLGVSLGKVQRALKK